MRWLAALCVACALALCLPAAQAADARNLAVSATGEKRVALVIGNNDYQYVKPLEKAVNDARAMGKALEQAQFRTRVVVNGSRAQMNAAINQFVDDISGGGIGVFFFAGHGVQVNNQNFLIPVDLQGVQREADIADQGVSLQGLQDKLADAKAKFSLLVIDACRENPLPRKAGRALGGTRGLTQASSAEGQMVVFSAGNNQQALDSLSDRDPNPNGVFTREFLPWVNKPGVSIREAVLGVRSAVRARAKTVNHEQFPAIYDQAEGDFYFSSRPREAQPAARPAAADNAVSPLAVELAFWDTIKGSSNAADFRDYIERFPNGQFVGLARNRLEPARAPVQTALAAPAQPRPTPQAPARYSPAPSSSAWSPARPARIIVPFAPGGGADIVGRSVAQALSTALGQAVLVENRPGAGGLIGAEAVAKAAPDGYSLLLANSSLLTMMPSLYASMPINVQQDLVPVAQLSEAPGLLIVHPSLQGLSLTQLAGRNLYYASVGEGSYSHLMAEKFRQVTGANWVNVPYKGTAPALSDLMANQVQVMFMDAGNALAHVQAGRISAVAASSKRRLAALPQVRTFAELGLTDMQVVSWYGLFAPAAIPPEAAKRWQQEVARLLATTPVRERFEALGFEVASTPPEQLKQQINSEAAGWARVIRTAGIQLQ